MKNEKCLKTTSKKALHRFAALAAVLFAVCLVFMTPVSAAWTADAGWGTDYDTSTEFTIADAGDLAQFAAMVNDGNDFSGKNVKLTADIDLGSQEWTPIGTMDKSFKGIFDGDGKTISGLSITNANNLISVGLFGYIEGGTVKNLQVSGNIDVSNSVGLMTGGIAGVNMGYVEDCSFTGADIKASVTISGDGGNSVTTAGGIVGVNSYGGSIKNCHSSTNVTVTSTNVFAYSGGIAGMDAGGVIESCYSLGDIEASATNSIAYAGVIVGQGKGTISKCYFVGSVKATHHGLSGYLDFNAHAGGIIGSTIGSTVKTISKCSSAGSTVTATSDNSQQTVAGGIVGVTGEYSFSNCYALTKEVSAETAGRVAGKCDPDGSLTSNFGWIGMKVNNNVVTEGTATDVNGESVYAKSFWDNQNLAYQPTSYSLMQHILNQSSLLHTTVMEQHLEMHRMQKSMLMVNWQK